MALNMNKKWTINKYVAHKQTTTTELQAPYFRHMGPAQTYRMWAAT